MANIASFNLSNIYEEDISVGTGTELISGPGTIWSITVVLDTSGTAVVSFSDSITNYDNTARCFKVVVSGPGTQHIPFPKGFAVATGLCVVSNIGSVDVSVVCE